MGDLHGEQGPYDDPRVRAIPWRDLVPQTRLEIAAELALSLPWLAGALVCGHLATGRHVAWIAGSLACSFYFFLTGLRQAHNAHHYALGLSRGATEWVLFALSLLMVSSMHAIQATHLHHHRHCLGEEDVEARTAHLPWWRALLAGPAFIASLHWHGLRLTLANARARRRRGAFIVAELAMIALWGALVFAWLDVPALRIHFALMAIGQCLTGFFAVWTVHHGCDPRGHIARTQRGWVKNLISYEMFFHVEHHLFPAVQTRRLPELARRLDAAAPELRGKLVF
jgi:fatty acid desaturase